MIAGKHTAAKYITPLAVILSLVFYWLTGYKIVRSEFITVYISYSLVFTAYLLLTLNIDNLRFSTLLWIGILFRLLFVFSVPALSNDYFRSIWDGSLLSEGLNPYN